MEDKKSPDARLSTGSSDGEVSEASDELYASHENLILSKDKMGMKSRSTILDMERAGLEGGEMGQMTLTWSDLSVSVPEERGGGIRVKLVIIEFDSLSQ